MSRMAGLVALLIAAPAGASEPMEAYLDQTSVEPRCRSAKGDEIMVCGRREADKYRLPFVPAPTAGDPKTRGVHEERSRLVAVQTPCEQRGAHLIGCGMVGFTVSTKLGTGKTEYRPIAP
ncbi:hypothetical protein HJG53_17890 [Sphingomonas sp. ID1715]|uniref:hypothetical protein n=1 Tax=Sphingomonas sp. ID1715 TaxID=1656898 RepID=UPI001489B432|nr:hypothetical protein [Sphingomonas sp. ID1715]NNM78762.1 hypothetical protein [Sphingomonas sp. ID1715]